MISQAKANIYLADKRKVQFTDRFTSYESFSDLWDRHHANKSFGSIYKCCDEVLDAGCSAQIEADESSYIILIPVIGAIAIKTISGEKIVAAGQAEFMTID